MREKQKGDKQKRVKGRQERAKHSLKVYICIYISAAFKHGWQFIIPLHSWHVATVAPEPLFPFKLQYFPRSETKRKSQSPSTITSLAEWYHFLSVKLERKRFIVWVWRQQTSHLSYSRLARSPAARYRRGSSSPIGSCLERPVYFEFIFWLSIKRIFNEKRQSPVFKHPMRRLISSTSCSGGAVLYLIFIMKVKYQTFYISEFYLRCTDNSLHCPRPRRRLRNALTGRTQSAWSKYQKVLHFEFASEKRRSHFTTPALYHVYDVGLCKWKSVPLHPELMCLL